MILYILGCNIYLDIVYDITMKNLETEENYKLQGHLNDLLLNNITDEEFENAFIQEIMCRYVVNHAIDHTPLRTIFHENPFLLDLIFNNFFIIKHPTALDVLLGDLVNGKFIDVEEYSQEEKIDKIVRKFSIGFYQEIHKDICDFLDFDSQKLAVKLASSLIKPIFGDIFDIPFSDLNLQQKINDTSDDPEDSFRTNEIASS